MSKNVSSIDGAQKKGVSVKDLGFFEIGFGGREDGGIGDFGFDCFQLNLKKNISFENGFKALYVSVLILKSLL